MSGIAVTRLGITIQEFYNMTPIEFHHSIKEFNELNHFRDELNIKTQYEVARWKVKHEWNMQILTAQGKTLKKVFNTVEEVEPFPWDEAKRLEPVQPSLKMMRLQMQQIANTYNKKKKR